MKANQLNDEDEGFCLTCKKPLDSVRLCDSCAGRRDQGKKMNDFIVKPPQVDTLKDQEKRDERMNNKNSIFDD